MSPPAGSELLVNDWQVNSPADAAAAVVLAHGAGAPMDSPFMAAMAEGLAACGWRVLRFEFPYMAKQRNTGRKSAPDRMPVLKDCFRAVAADARRQGALFIGGKSMGGRIASLLADELTDDLGVAGCLCLGYPFHPPGKPQQLRTEHLAALRTPTLILQSERDPFGRREEVETYTLSPQVQVEWLPAGDHSFKPTKSSGLSEADNWQTAVSRADHFLRAVLAA